MVGFQPKTQSAKALFTSGKEVVSYPGSPKFISVAHTHTRTHTHTHTYTHTHTHTYTHTVYISLVEAWVQDWEWGTQQEIYIDGNSQSM